MIVDGKRDISGRYIPFKRSVRHLDRQTSCQKFLILHGTRRQLRRASIATMKAHKGIAVCIIKIAENIRFKHIPQDRIVDVKQCNNILGHANADILAERTVNIHLAGNRNPTPCQTAVDVAGHKAKLRLKCRPVFTRNRAIFLRVFMRFNPIEQRQFILRKLFKDFGLLVSSPSSLAISAATAAILPSPAWL